MIPYVVNWFLASFSNHVQTLIWALLKAGASANSRAGSENSDLRDSFNGRRSLSRLATKEDNLFNYTSGRWLYNESLRLQERQLVFDIDEFMSLAAKSVDRRSSDIIEFSKLAEGDCHRVFRITFSDNFQMVARVPYPATGPKYYGLASEVATMEYLRLSGIPVPKVYGYDPGQDNAVGMAYIFMEYVEGRSLNDVWSDLEDKEIVDVVRQITQIEGKMSKLSFPAGGSLYFANDLEKVGLQGVPVPGHERFRIGPDTRLLMWHKKRAQLGVDRIRAKRTDSIDHTAEDALVAGAHKEVAFLKRFGKRVQPTRRHRTSNDTSPSATAFIPEDPDLQRFSITHPDLEIIDNIIVNSDFQIVSLIDWQNTAVLPEFNEQHYKAFNESLFNLRWRLFDYSSLPWEGETIELTALLIATWKIWVETRPSEVQCPFDYGIIELLPATNALLQAYAADKLFDEFQATAGIGKAGWVSRDDYALARVMVDAGRELIIGKGELTEEEKKQLMGQWHWDDIDEETLAG
ncbi:kinase-like domain-containing protein [Coprinopsis sp. MPI-PUGE-AT-0042]|nr:kinase-like domain-containing protein [Coprinopsis sp. MPI-PUGE-AT-0042]